MDSRNLSFAGRLPNGWRYWRWGGRGFCLGAEELEARKMLENAVTLKSLEYTRTGKIKLHSKSHKHNARIEDAEKIEIKGRVVAVLRKY